MARDSKPAKKQEEEEIESDDLHADEVREMEASLLEKLGGKHLGLTTDQPEDEEKGNKAFVIMPFGVKAGRATLGRVGRLNSGSGMEVRVASMATGKSQEMTAYVLREKQDTTTDIHLSRELSALLNDLMEETSLDAETIINQGLVFVSLAQKAKQAGFKLAIVDDDGTIIANIDGF